MKASTLRLTALAVLFGPSGAVVVTSGSSCSQQCGNVLDATTPADIVCSPSQYGSAAGIVLKNCMNCELTSTYYTTNPNSTDQQWLLYNARYALSECLWGEPGGNTDVDADVAPCLTSRACGPLQDAIQYANFSTSTNVDAYDYCTDWSDSTFVTGCENCLRSASEPYLANFVALLQVGCDQMPNPGSTVSISGSIFSTTLINETAPTPTSSWTNIDNSGPISLGAKVGIAIGGLCLILAVTGFCIVCNGRRRRRAFLKKLEMRHKDSGWPHPFGSAPVVQRGPDMNDTPMSQKPLRGWDDSPQSATTSEPSYARYFSPYSTQHNSPVNAADVTMAAQQWPQEFHNDLQPSYSSGYPTSAQEKAMQHRHEAATAAGTESPPMQIGVALGGSEPSLRSKVSNPSVQSKDGMAACNDSDKNNGNVESYELHEVSSSAGGSISAGGHNNSFRNRIARENHAPILQHPGPGRYSPDRMFPPPPPRAMHGATRDGDYDGGLI